MQDWNGGDANAPERLMPLVYDEMRRFARTLLSRERAGHTLQPTALVNSDESQLAEPSTLYGIASSMIGRVLIDHARAQDVKRGAIEITSGQTARIKQVGVAGVQYWPWKNSSVSDG